MPGQDELFCEATYHRPVEVARRGLEPQIKVGKQCPYVNFSHVEQSLLFNYLSDPEASQTTHDD
jgi:hypothetical protein